VILAWGQVKIGVWTGDKISHIQVLDILADVLAHL
jgi:hypothetical protein